MKTFKEFLNEAEDYTKRGRYASMAAYLLHTKDKVYEKVREDLLQSIKASAKKAAEILGVDRIGDPMKHSSKDLPNLLNNLTNEGKHDIVKILQKHFGKDLSDIE